ncbi:Imm26 family immunity protein [Pseudomonas sp. NPDC089996]|uniref:Imm26 family immunity protein n=1 Tax=Pseudomonas sp. NPDC089996 TaxID=3364474 RepID=UPI003818A6BF
MTGDLTMHNGDYFLIPMEDGRSAIGQIIWLGSESKEQKFKKVFAFGVLSVGDGKVIPEGEKFLSFENYRGVFTVIFTAFDKLKSGEWKVIRSGTFADSSWGDFEFNMAGTLYRRGQVVRILDIDEYQNHLLMSVSGFALVERYLQQY